MDQSTLMTILMTFIFIVESFSSDEIRNSQNKEDKHDFDVFIFTQHWPATVCYKWKETNKDHQCILPSPKEIWTIHGIWPTKLHTIGPEFCNKSLAFDMKALEPIEPQLEQFWLNIEKGTPLESLWRHEWEKHGTCAAQIPQLDNENKYFGQGLAWLQQYSMSSLLSQANIQPGAAYPLELIAKVLRTMLNYNPAIGCVKDHETGKSYLFEIKICFTKDLKLTGCDGTKGLHESDKNWKFTGDVISNCDHTKLIEYPGLVPMTQFEEAVEDDFDENPLWRFPFVKAYKIIKILQWATL